MMIKRNSATGQAIRRSHGEVRYSLLPQSAALERNPWDLQELLPDDTEEEEMPKWKKRRTSQAHGGRNESNHGAMDGRRPSSSQWLTSAMPPPGTTVPNGGLVDREDPFDGELAFKAVNVSKPLQYARLVLPHIGLVLLSVLYICGGAVAFYQLERPYEVSVRNTNLEQIARSRRDFLINMWTMLNDDHTDADHWHRAALTDMDNVTKLLFEAFDTHYISAGHLRPNQSASAVQTDDTWTLITAVFFTTTLLTTIGYGNLVPVTFEGRMFCIGYGLFGVPLILITIADIGKFLSENIVWMYCRYVNLKKRLRKAIRRRRTNDASNVSSQVLPLDDDEQTKMRLELEKFGLEDFISIPVSLILGILIGYIAIGAVLLGSWEQWDFFSGFYFSFITMTTVGFGDIVPVEQAYFLLDLLYIIIGLAITTMCIDLVGIQYIRKIHYFGRAIKDARYALVNVGGKMVHVPDLMRYASVLQQKYGLKNKTNIVDNPFDRYNGAFAPKEIRHIRYIDYGALASCESLHSFYSNCLKDTASIQQQPPPTQRNYSIPEESV